jgi:hypothetical protein
MEKANIGKILALITCLLLFTIIVILLYSSIPMSTNVNEFCKDAYELINMPMSECLSRAAYKLSDISLCEQINESYSKQNCIISLIQYRANDSSICNSLKEKDYRDFCKIVISKDLKKAKECEKLKELKQNCLDSLINIIIYSPDFYSKKENYSLDSFIEVCNLMTNFSRDSCLSKLVPYYPEVEICEIMKNQGLKDNCYSNLAWSKADNSLCEKISNIYQKEACITNVEIALA